ncbi:hypothetical protein H6B11_12085 [Mediterraneibacter glycyrrhizinilyticus]|nr:hypothetical protein [Mediterraneibacter glycyrrhizinilyticus]MBM6854879.1 hypothetical protein [Mediterraneibacter glycyrrhizinilyticus]
MSNLLVLRERLRMLYAAYSVYILKILQFIMGLILFGTINANVGFMQTASSAFCTIGLAVICTFFPMIVMVLAGAALTLVHFYALSMPIAVVSLVIFLIMYIFYFRFTPGKAWLVLIAALAFGMKVPFIVPVIFGLLGTPVWIVPAACGTIAYYMIHFVKASSAALQSAGAEGMYESLMSFTRQVLTSREMWLMVMTMVIGTLVVNTVRTRSTDHAWKIASAAGAVVCVVVSAAGNILLNLNYSYAVIIVSAVLGILIGLVLEVMFFSVDYSRTEHIQFEDDEYYYYVKAVPKTGVPVPEKKVKHITGQQAADDRESGTDMEKDKMSLQEKDQVPVNSEKAETLKDRTTDEILLTRSLSKELGLDQEEKKTE